MEIDVTKKLLEHMKWANQNLFSFLLSNNIEIFKLSAWDHGWTIEKIVNHLVIAQDRYVSRLSGLFSIEDKFENSDLDGMRNLALRSSENDKKLIEFASMEDKLLTFNQNGKIVNFHASVVLAQSIHHATEHRAQIDDILSFSKVKNINLDLIDVWSYERFLNSK